MQLGYKLLRKRKTVEACDIWLECWERLKPLVPAGITTIEEMDKLYPFRQFLFNWCQDLEKELCNAGVADPSYHELRIEYCNEFCRVFPKTDGLLLENMKWAAAESYFALGRADEGEHAFAALAKEFPDSFWLYMNWGDMYAMPSITGGPFDYNKARRLYGKARTLATSEVDKDEVAERLKELEEECRKRERPNEVIGGAERISTWPRGG